MMTFGPIFPHVLLMWGNSVGDIHSGVTPPKSIFTGAQYVTLDNKIKMSTFSCLFFGNPTNKSVSGTAYMWGLLNSKPPEPILMIDNHRYWAAVRSNLLRTVLEVHNCVAPCTSHGQAPQIWCRKTNFLS
jgi:hypothetical protein